MSYYRNDYNSQELGDCPDNPSLYPIFTKNVIYGYMTHRYTYQKDTTYTKALDYLDSNKIYDLKSNSDCSVFEAKSLGSDGNIYNCRLTLSNKKIIDFKCTCMSYLKWHTLCKHLIGMMILIERKRQELLSRQTVTVEKKQELPSPQTITVKTSIPESNFTIYTCANCGTKYRKYEKVCPLCGSDKRLIGVASENEQQRMQEVKERLVREKRQFPKQNDYIQKSPTTYNSENSCNPNNKESSNNNASNNNNDGYVWLIAILIYVVVSVVLGLMGGNIGFGFIASILLFVFLGIIKKIFF